MLIQEAQLSVYCFLSTLSSVFVFLLPYLGCQGLYRKLEARMSLFLFVYFSLMVFTVRITLIGHLFKVSIRACLLGIIFSSGLFVALMGESSYAVFGWYMCIMSFFHWSEYVTIAVTNPWTLSIDSYMLDHSLEYKIAAVSSWLEFYIEQSFCPGLKSSYRWVSVVGLVMCVGGEAMRKMAMFTAKMNFNHIVQSEKRDGHTLVTHGVYSLCRHPSYAGWFYWAIGTQVVLCNPICGVGYLLASWKFFYDRITVEEVTLLNFFQYDYIKYQERVPTGLPFIEGYLVHEA